MTVNLHGTFWDEQGGRVVFPCDPALISTADPGLFPAISSPWIPIQKVGGSRSVSFRLASGSHFTRTRGNHLPFWI